MPSPGVIRVRVQPASLDLQVEGSGTMIHSQAMRAWVEGNLSHAPRLRVDLSGCTYMDSTFIGTLLGLKRLAESQPGGGIVLVCPSAACRQLLDQMRIGRIFSFEPESPCAGEGWQEVCVETGALKTLDFKRNVVEAHQQLACCEGPTGDRFRQLADDMARELDQERPTM